MTSEVRADDSNNNNNNNNLFKHNHDSTDSLSADAADYSELFHNLSSSLAKNQSQQDEGGYDIILDNQQQNIYKDEVETTKSINNIDEYDDSKDRLQTISMTAFFLTSMVFYIGFCFYYRRGKARRLVSDEGGSGGDNSNERSLRRRQNQAVLDESISAASRARTNAEEQAKLKERKRNIQKALLLRLIVEDDEEEREETSNANGAGKEDCGKNCECEHCLYWRWDSTAAAAGGEMIIRGGDQDLSDGGGVGALKRGVITIQEEDGEDDSNSELMASEDEAEGTDLLADALVEVKNNHGEIKEHSLEKKDQGKEQSTLHGKIEDDTITKPLSTTSTTLSSPKLAPLSPTLSPITPPDHFLSTPPTSPIPSSRLLSLSSPKRYSDALLNCGSSGSSRKSYADALNCGNNAVRHAMTNCSSNHSTNCGSNSGGGIHGCKTISKDGNKNNSNSNSNNGIPATDTISLAAIITSYGEECNICLSQFQVGDRAAWSKDYDHVNADDDDGALATGMHGCTHVFHEECISRWLLVRDGCPICRRSYFLDGDDASDSVVGSTGDSLDVGAILSANNGNNGEIDLELGVRE